MIQMESAIKGYLSQVSNGDTLLLLGWQGDMKSSQIAIAGPPLELEPRELSGCGQETWPWSLKEKSSPAQRRPRKHEQPSEELHESLGILLPAPPPSHCPLPWIPTSHHR